MPVALLIVVFALHLPGFTDRVFNTDEAYIATVADVLGNGGRLYVDTVDRKPPGVFYLYHWLFEITGSRSLWIPRMLGVGAHTATAVLVWVFARRRFDERAAMLVGVLAAFTSVTVTPDDAQSAEFEVFMMPFLAAAMLLADRRRPFASGLAIGVATMMKQTAAVTLLPLAFVLWRRREQRWSGLSLFALGAALPVAACAVIFGIDRFWFWVFGGANGGYLDVGTGGIGIVLGKFFSMTAAMIGLNLGLLFLAAVAVRSWRTDLDLWLWLLSACIGVASGTRFFGHYYWQLMPPLCLLAGRGLSLLSRRIGAAAVSIAAVTAVGATLAAAALRLGGPGNDYQALADYARANTEPTDRIFVWGHKPSVFWAADRLPASRIITTGFLTGHSAVRPEGFAGIEKAVPGVWDDVMADLAERPPVLFFDTQAVDPSVSADYPIMDYPPMQEFVTAHYQQVAVIDTTTIYRLIEP
ncbi:MAG: ArnT family glycosyltransferase [Mycobacterium sp.]